MDRYWCPELSENVHTVTLDREQSHHLVRVLRQEVGASVLLVSGTGAEAEATILTARPNEVTLTVRTFTRAAAPPRLHLAFGIVKGQALDFVFHRVTELGIASFRPIFSRHSTNRGPFNVERWERVVREVCKQSQQAYFPKVEPPQELADFLAAREKRPLVFCSETARHPTLVLPLARSVDLLIGPEGGWAPDEIDLVGRHAALGLGLGPTRLRAETACVAATVAVKIALGEMPGGVLHGSSDAHASS